MAVKVLHVVHGLSRGGLENGVVNLLNRLPPEEIAQAVCCLDVRGEMADRILHDVPVHVLDRGRHDFSIPLKLAGLLRDWRPDVVHCRNWNTWLDAVAGHRLAGRQGMLIWSFHGFADGHWFPYRRRLASRLLARLTDRLFAVCRDSAERFSRLAGIPEARFDVLYNGVDCERFKPATDRRRIRRELGFADDELILLTVASLTPVKDHLTLVEAAARVRREMQQRLRFLFIGEGGERPRLQTRIEELDLADVVQMPGSSDRVPEILAASDLFVLPSRLEGMSNAILEAMASGLPVVANAVGGNLELVESGVSGLLCPQGDVFAMAEAISELVRDDARRQAMGRASRRRAAEVFGLDRMMHNYAAYYRRAAGGL